VSGVTASLTQCQQELTHFRHPTGTQISASRLITFRYIALSYGRSATHVQPGNYGPQANNDKVNPHDPVQQIGEYDYENSENSGENSPQQAFDFKNITSLHANHSRGMRFPSTAAQI
jgi:hypothetical protein